MPYYEASAVLMTFLVLGRWLEARARGGTSEAIRRLLDLQPRTARVLRDGAERDLPIAAVRGGRPGPRAARRARGGGRRAWWRAPPRVDESMLTGESLPVAKGPGERPWWAAR